MPDHAIGNAIGITQDICRWDANNLNTKAVQFGVASHIEFGLVTHIVRNTIDLKGGPRGMAVKINNEVTKWVLVTKPYTHRFDAKYSPKQHFWKRHFPAQSARTLDRS